jgi:hypothetical protein
VKGEDVYRLSPLQHENINMLGRSSFSMPEAVAKGELRPLRNPEDANSGESLTRFSVPLRLKPRLYVPLFEFNQSAPPYASFLSP